MWYSLAIVGGSVALVLILGWRLRRYQRDIDEYQQREYRDPPAFQWQGPL